MGGVISARQAASLPFFIWMIPKAYHRQRRGVWLNIAARSSDGTEYVYGYFIPERLQGGSALLPELLDANKEYLPQFFPARPE